jgi:hypothetical protein
MNKVTGKRPLPEPRLERIAVDAHPGKKFYVLMEQQGVGLDRQPIFAFAWSDDNVTRFDSYEPAGWTLEIHEHHFELIEWDETQSIKETVLTRSTWPAERERVRQMLREDGFDA